MNNRKRALLCIHSFYPNPNANTNASYVIISELIKKYNLDVIAVGESNSNVAYGYLGSKVVLTKKDGSFVGKMRLNLNACVQSNSILKKTMYFLKRHFARVVFKTSNYYKLVCSKLKKENYDFVFSISSPFEIHFPILQMKDRRNFRWICILQDSYSTYLPYFPIKKELEKLEDRVYKKADLVFVNDPLFKENQRNRRSAYLNKTHISNWGNMCAIKYCARQKPAKRNDIKCIFAGSVIDYKIRNPEDAFLILSKVVSSIRCSFLVNNQSQRVIDSFNSINVNPKVTLMFAVPQAEATRMINEADILINIGNKVENLLPSKILEYIATGKPIVNFYSIKSDLARNVLERYPLSLNVSLEENTVEECVRKFNVFCLSNYNKRLSEDKIAALYPEFSYGNIRDSFFKAINEL